MRRLADARFRRRQTERLAHAAIEPRPWVGRLWPAAFVERPQDDDIGLLQAGLEGPQDGEPGMPRPRRSDGLIAEETAVELRIVGRRQLGRIDHAGVEKAGKQSRKLFAPIALPERVLALLAKAAGQRLRRAHMRRRPALAGCAPGRSKQRLERPQDRLEACQQLARRLPSVRPDLPDRPAAVRAGQRAVGRALQGGDDVGEAASQVGGAKDRQLQRAGAVGAAGRISRRGTEDV